MIFDKTSLSVILVLTFMRTFAKINKETHRKESLKVINFQYAFRDLKVNPDVISNYPYQQLQVTYEGGIKVNPGDQLTPTQVKNQPEVNYIADPKAYYALCMTDPDAPSRKEPKFREWHHWLVVNIPGRDVAAGEVLSEYIGAGPPKGTGLHRYVFVLFRQRDGKMTFNEPKLTCKSGEGRANFSILKFAAKHNFTEPFAGNVFLAEWDDYVPKLYEQLGG